MIFKNICTIFEEYTNTVSKLFLVRLELKYLNKIFMLNINKRINNDVVVLFVIGMLLIFNSCNQEPVNYLNETPEAKDKRMEWWREARFGMFIHWGLYAIPAGEWNGETNHAEWIRTTAQIPLEEYDGLVNEFNPIKFDPKSWVKMAKEAGMQYIVITSKHHDGFCLFDSEYTEFDVMSTPWKRDVMDELAKACRKEGIKICWYYSIMDWHHPDYIPRREWEKTRSSEVTNFEDYFQYMKNQLEELVKNYGDISVLWFDGEWEGSWTSEYGSNLYNYVRNLQADIIINNRVDVGRSGMAGINSPGNFVGDFGTPEQEIPLTGIKGLDWETCMTMNDHWGYNKADNNWKSTKELIRDLVDIVSKGGNFLLNVGPTAEGLFPQESIDRLAGIGAWMGANNEAVYATGASPFKELPWGRCTQKEHDIGTRLYLHVFDWPEDGILKVPGIYNSPQNSFLLVDKAKKNLKVKRWEEALHINLPKNPPDPINTVVVLDILGQPDISFPPVIQSEHGIFVDMMAVNLTSDRENVEIRYTLDGSIPDSNSPLFEEPIIVKETTTIAARCFRENKVVSESAMATLIKVDPLPASITEELDHGLAAYYYEGDWDSLPDFNEISPLKSIKVDNFTLEPRMHDDYYGFSFEGIIEITETGVYDFYTDSDDGSELYIDDTLVVDNDGLHGLKEKGDNIPLSKGFHKIKVNYFEKGGGDVLKVYYKPPGKKKELIPDTILFKKKK